MTTFEHLGLSEEILTVLEELDFKKPTEIQVQAIPQLLESFDDFIGLAQTGTGKTAAFGLPLLERIDPFNKYTQALVLAPTRELGQQIAEQLDKYSKYLEKVNVLAVYGGSNISAQMRALRKPQHIIIATPGRLIDLIKRKAVKLNQLSILVLDEADEMLNMGFKDELDEILRYTPQDKLTWLFSATMPAEIKKIVKKYMSHPVEVRIDPKNTVNTNIVHQYSVLKQTDKLEALSRFIDLNSNMRALVFCRTKRGTQSLAEELLKKKYQVDALHGDMSQPQRDRVMRRFKSHALQILIATDVAARGIDVNDLTHVFHFTLPDDMSYYTHRSGRTARAGKRGKSIAFIGAREHYKIQRLEKQLKISFEHIRIPRANDIAELRIENWCLEVLEKKTKKKIDPQLLDKVGLLFGNLSKEELMAKVLMMELEKLNLTLDKDLNLAVAAQSSVKKPPRSKRYRGGGGAGKKTSNKRPYPPKGKSSKKKKPKWRGKK